MYIHGFLLVLFTAIVYNYFLLINTTLWTIIAIASFYLILAIILGISFNKMYISYAIDNIERYKKEYHL